MSETLTLARYAASTSCMDIPAEVKERAKQVIFDEMACGYFGRRSIAGDLAARYAIQFGGHAESSILGTSWRAPAIYAALANGAAGHGEEVDGTHVVGGHPGASLVHAAVAMAERQRATGGELLNAVVLAYDVSVRIIEACGEQFSIRKRFGLHSDFLYTFGAAAAASRLLGLDAQRHCHALALAIFQANGLWAMFGESRHISKSLCNGQWASTGISAALMAATGLEGQGDILGAKYGVLEAWGEKDRREALTRRLGESFAIMGANFKFLNAGYPIHAAMEATMTLVDKHAIKADAIESIYVGMSTNTVMVVDNRDMHNICLQDVLSAALVRGGVNLRESPFPEVLADPAFQRLRPRVNLRADAELDRDLPEGRAAIVRITTAGGTTVSHRVDWPRGHSKRGGVTWDELSVKWRQGLPECDVDRMIAAARNLEDLDDASELASLFSAKA